MSVVTDRYRQVLLELELERLLRGGSLPQEVELAYAERFEPLWAAMSAGEHAEVEASLTSSPVVVAEPELHERDCDVPLDSSDPPREAA